MIIKYLNKQIKKEVNNFFRDNIRYEDGIYINIGGEEDKIEFTDECGGNMFYCILVDLVAKYNIDFVDYNYFVVKDKKENVETN